MTERETMVRAAAAKIELAAGLLDHAMIILDHVKAEPELLDVWRRITVQARVPLIGMVGAMEDLANRLSNQGGPAVKR